MVNQGEKSPPKNIIWAGWYLAVQNYNLMRITEPSNNDDGDGGNDDDDGNSDDDDDESDQKTCAIACFFGQNIPI